MYEYCSFAEVTNYNSGEHKALLSSSVNIEGCILLYHETASISTLTLALTIWFKNAVQSFININNNDKITVTWNSQSGVINFAYTSSIASSYNVLCIHKPIKISSTPIITLTKN